MFKLVIAISRHTASGIGVSSQVVEFVTKTQADEAFDQLIAAQKYDEYHRFSAVKLYV